jgi:hypothetical protein
LTSNDCLFLRDAAIEHTEGRFKLTVDLRRALASRHRPSATARVSTALRTRTITRAARRAS